MTIYELHTRFKDQVDKLSSSSMPDIPAEQVDRILNQAVERFVKQRYTGNNFKQEGFEESQKRTDDLRTLVKSEVLTSISSTPECYYKFKYLTFPIPNDYWFTVKLSYKKDTDNCGFNCYYGVFVSSQNTLHEHLKSPFHRPNKYKVIALYNSKGIDVYHLDDETPTVLELTYIQKPTPLVGLSSEELRQFSRQTNLTQPLKTYNYHSLPIAGDFTNTINGFTFNLPNYRNLEYFMPEHTHSEIATIAAQIALEMIESSRLQSFTTTQLSTQE